MGGNGMTVNKSEYEYCIEVEDGEYHAVLTKDYHVKFLRHGENWVDNPPGSKMMIALMAETERKEEEIARLRKALEAIKYEICNDGSMSEIAWIAEEALRIGKESNAL